MCSHDLHYIEQAAYQRHKLERPTARQKFQDNCTYPGSPGINLVEFEAAAPAEVTSLAGMFDHVMAMKWTAWLCNQSSTAGCSPIMQAPLGAFCRILQLAEHLLPLLATLSILDSAVFKLFILGRCYPHL